VRQFREGGLLAALIITVLAFGLADPAFLAVDNLTNIVSQVAVFGVLAVGMTYVLIAGEIDLSVGSVLGLVSVLFGLMLQDHVPMLVAIVLALGAGTVLGALNGILSVTLRVSTIIVTLGTLNVFRGLAYMVSNGYPVENYDKTGTFFDLGQEKIAGVVPYTAVVMIGFAVISALVLRKMVSGHRIYAMGSNPRAAQLSGIRVDRIRIGVTAFIGLAAALGGVMSVAQTATANPNTGMGYELTTIAAVIIGGAKLSGGAGTVLGTILGILLIGTISNGLVFTGVSIYAQLVVSGAIVVIAVAINRFIDARGSTDAARTQAA
jgi:ribose transport system permease protein